MTDLTIEAEMSDDETTDILARMIMAARRGDDEAFEAAKAEGEAFLGIGGAG